MRTFVVTTTAIGSTCTKCSTTPKSGRMSCCGPGGSWFGSCGASGNSKFKHTWYEGIRACETGQPMIAMGPQQSAVQQKHNDSANDTVMAMNSKSVVVAANIVTFTLVTTSTKIPGTMAGVVSARNLINTLTSTPTRMTVASSMLSTVSVHTPVHASTPHYTAAKTSKTITTATTINVRNSVNMLKSIIPPTDRSITISVKRTIIKSHHKSMHKTLADMITNSSSFT